MAAAVAARSGGSSASAVGNPPNGVWRSGMGDHGPANSEKDHDYDDDDSDGDYDEEEAGNYQCRRRGDGQEHACGRHEASRWRFQELKRE